MKTISIQLIIYVMLLCIGCNDDNTPSYSNVPPEIILNTQEITAAAGSTVTIQGQITDEFGVKFLTIFSGALALNKKIDVSTRNEIRSSFQLSYNLEVPEDPAGSEYTIQLSAKNLTGQVTNKNIRLIVTQ